MGTGAWAVLIIGAVLLLGIAWLNGSDATWVRAAQARTSGREQVVLFQREIENGARIDRDDPYLPRLDAEVSENRRLNYKRCRVQVQQAQALGIVRRVRFDDPRLLFVAEIDMRAWREQGADPVVFEDLACVFAAGDVRRYVRFRVFDGGREVGQWRYAKWVPAQ